MDFTEAFKTVVRPNIKDSKDNETSLCWGHIKEFVNSLSDEQLQQHVNAMGEYSYSIFGISILQDDLIDPSGEGLEPKSQYMEDGELSEDEFDESIVYPKGTIFLMIDDDFVEHYISAVQSTQTSPESH